MDLRRYPFRRRTGPHAVEPEQHHEQREERGVRPRTLDHLNLEIVSDGRHSLPTRISVRAGEGPKTYVKLARIPKKSRSGLARRFISTMRSVYAKRVNG